MKIQNRLISFICIVALFFSFKEVSQQKSKLVNNLTSNIYFNDDIVILKSYSLQYAKTIVNQNNKFIINIFRWIIEHEHDDSLLKEKKIS